MEDLPDLHLDSPIDPGNNRYMFFFGGINHVFLAELHRLTAANKFPNTLVKDLYNIPAYFTFVDLFQHCHYLLLFK
jgi:hypothetical protein